MNPFGIFDFGFWIESSNGLITLFTLGALLFAFFIPVEAQQTRQIPRIGYLAGAADRKSLPVEAFKQGLRDFGYVEGKNIQVEFRYTEGTTNPVSRLVAELVRLKPDVLVIGQRQTAIRVANQATKTLPIVIYNNSGSRGGPASG